MVNVPVCDLDLNHAVFPRHAQKELLDPHCVSTMKFKPNSLLLTYIEFMIRM